jgi:shikimate kinase
MPPRVVLVGPPGSGKSTAARLLAERLGTTWRDTDIDVEQLAGASISDIFVDHGETHFRELEARAVETALAEHDGVLAVGGGAVLDDTTRARLDGLRVVFLDVSITDAAKRIGFNRDRPLLLGNPRAQWIRLMEARRGLYEQVAIATVVTDGKSPDEVADEIAERVAQGADP